MNYGYSVVVMRRKDRLYPHIMEGDKWTQPGLTKEEAEAVAKAVNDLQKDWDLEEKLRKEGFTV